MSVVDRVAQYTASADNIGAALDIMGPDGTHWIKGQLEAVDPATGITDYCVAGALIATAPTYQVYETSRQSVKATLGGGNIDRWNNRPDTTWGNVVSVLSNTISWLRGNSAPPPGAP